MCPIMVTVIIHILTVYKFAMAVNTAIKRMRADHPHSCNTYVTIRPQRTSSRNIIAGVVVDALYIANIDMILSLLLRHGSTTLIGNSIYQLISVLYLQ